MSEITALARVEQLPVIVENLKSIKTQVLDVVQAIKDMTDSAESMAEIKAKRTEMSKWFRDAEDARKAIKAQIMEPYDRFEATYKECISNPINEADAYMKARLSEVESAIKGGCEEKLREYFDELAYAGHVEWLAFESIPDFKIDMASAKAKTPTKLMKQIKAYVDGVVSDVGSIAMMDNAAEVMAEYKAGHTLAEAIAICKERSWRVLQESMGMEQTEAMLEQDAKAETAVNEALQPPEEIPEPEELIEVTFTVTDTRDRLIALREWMKQNGYNYK